MKPETIDKIREHYNHAVEKHPKFCNWFYSGSHDGAKEVLSMFRNCLKSQIRTGLVDSDNILHCEIAEIYEAYTGGRLDDAKEECYDAIAVLLRMIDMIESEQMKPEVDDFDIEETITDLREEQSRVATNGIQRKE